MAAGLKVEGMKSLWKDGLLTDASHIALFTAEPNLSSGSQNEFVTASSADYARVALTKASWTVSGGVATYGAVIEFDAETPSAWQGAAWVALVDTATLNGGNLLFTADISDVTIDASRRVYIASNALTVDLNTSASSLTDAGADKAFKDGLFSATEYLGFLDSSDTEISGTSYARTAITAATMTVASSTGVCSNGSVVASPAAGAGDWGDPRAAGIYDTLTGADLLAQADFTTDIGAPANGQKISFAIGQLSFDLGVAA